MADNLTPEKRSWNMSRIKSADTKIEIKVRKYLYHNGFRYRKNVKTLPGKPDILLLKYKAVIFIHGCFWHRHQGCKDATLPKTRTEFWADKLNRNVENDIKNYKILKESGFNVFVLWECQINKSFKETMEELVAALLK